MIRVSLVLGGLVLIHPVWAETIEQEMISFRKQVILKCALREEGDSVIMDKTCMAKMAEAKLAELCRERPEFASKCKEKK